MLFVFLRKHKGTVISAINKKSVGMYFQLDVSVICFRRCRVYSRQRQIYIRQRRKYTRQRRKQNECR
ncbi:hypothetical protein B5F96_14240 [Parabacteroides johnsonii]|uniref:Uncharacterized protein n=1 Tax=Parabacteroides johnsonii TaxID=387661 RepID=A0A9Q5X766_9BACT|nr:hypothetical protein B5F96_14240 [Parabacteroides johnsonii]